MIPLQIENQIKKANKQLRDEREEYKTTELRILNSEKASIEGLDHHLSKFQKQKEGLQATRQHIAGLSETGIAV